MKTKFLLLLLLVQFFACKNNSSNKFTWTLVARQPNKTDIEICNLPTDLTREFTVEKVIQGIRFKFQIVPKEQYSIFKASAESDTAATRLHFSIRANYGSSFIPFNFDGEVNQSEIYRQSPHDVDAWIVKDIARQAVPVIAFKRDGQFTVALNGTPALYENFTSQAFYPEIMMAELSSGDNGATPGLKPDTSALKIEYNTDKTQKMAPGKILPYYHPVNKGTSHTFEGIIFNCKAENVNQLRRSINHLAANHFSGGKVKDYFGALSFTTAYMNLRVNETAKSKFWVVPSVEYGNTQYCRDAFWISTMLPPEYSAECLKNELAAVNTYAEYPLMAVLWAYRSFREGKEVDLKQVQEYIDAIETRVKNNWFYSYTEKDGRLDFQYWGDVIAFEKDDVVTYNQGLFALTLEAAHEMGLKTKSDPRMATANYRSLYNSEEGFYPISKKKNIILGPDPLIPDLISQVYFNSKLLETAKVLSHYNIMVKRSKTPYGFKVVSLPDGSFLPDSMYDVPGYVSQVNREKMPNGSYFKGGSYFLYDNLFLIDAYLHGIKEAENELIWRVSLDFKIGATTYECLNTITGEPWKPNMGWNTAVYAIWRKLADEGKADEKLFETVDGIVDLRP